ncbi:hypothetical protein FACS1894202_06990 [Clostridia bacterium]|nr:hypothetical protein FACS1894202_06990 [Clostridia bacterium]
MATREKFRYYSALSDSTLRDLTNRRGDWQRFLGTAAQLYKYSFQDQVMIYAQKPGAVACAEIPLWNEQFNRWVRRGTKGIALIDDSGSYPDLKYVFDVTDTEPSRFNARPVRLWEMTAEYKPLVLAELEKNYEDVDGDSLGATFRNIAKQLANEYYDDNAREILYQAENSALEPPDAYGYDTPIEMVDDSALRAAFVETLSASAAYSVMTRCGLDPSEYFDDEDFRAITDFDTPMMANAIGAATADVSEQVLRDIELTIRKYERVKNAQRANQDPFRASAQNAERSEENYDRNPYLQPSGGLSSPQHQTERIAARDNAAAGSLRANEESVSQGTPQDNVQPPVAVGGTVPAPAGSGRTGDGAVGAGDEIADSADGLARQGGRPVEMGGGDEHAESPSGGTGAERIDLRVLDESEPPIQPPLEAAQTQNQTFSQVGKTSIEELLSTSAVTIAEVDSILRDGGNDSASYLRIAARFAKAHTPDEQAAFLRREYLQGKYSHGERESGKGFDFGNHRVCAWFDGDGITLAIGATAKNNIHRVTIPWDTAAARVNELMLTGEYADRPTFDHALDNERLELAGKLWFFYRDDMHFIPEEWNAEHGGYPEDEALIKSLLDDEDSRQAILDRLEADVNQFNYDEHERVWNSPDLLLANMRESMLPPAIFANGEYQYKRDFTGFITQDEIDAYLMRRGDEMKFDILSKYLTSNGDKDFTAFLKNSYGLGGGTHALGGADNSYGDYSPGKGIVLSRGRIGDPFAKVNLNWNQAAKRIKTLIESGQFMTRAELDGIRSYEKLELVRNINSFFSGLPEEYERPFAGKTGIYPNEYHDENGERTLDFHYPHEAEWNAINDLLDNPDNVYALLARMEPIYVNTPEDDRYYNLRKRAWDRLNEWRDGAFTLFPGVEHLPDSEMARPRKVAAATREVLPREDVIDLGERNSFDWQNQAITLATQLTLFDLAEENELPILPSVEEQRTVIDDALKQEAAEVENRENETFLNISNEDKARLYEQFADNPRSRAAVNLVKEIYGDTLNMPLPQAIQKIAELVEMGLLDGVGDPYDLFDNVRDELEQRGYAVSGELVEDGINLFRTQVGHGEFADVADFIVSEYLSEEAELGEDIDAPKTEMRLHAVGDFYELRNDDAYIAAEVLGLKVVMVNDVPVVGFPNRVFDDYVRRMADTGYTVLLPESVETEKSAPSYKIGDRLIYSGKLHEITKIDNYVQLENRELDNPSRFPIFDRVSVLREQFELALANGEITFEPPQDVQTEPVPETIAEVEPAAAIAEPEQLAQNVPAPDFEEVKQIVYDRVMADENFAYHLQFAQNRGALRSPLNAALDKVVGAMKWESDAYADYFNDDITDDLFDHVYKTAWENRPQPEASHEAETPEPQFTEITDPAEIAEIEAIFGETPQTEPIAVVDDAARQNFNLFALTFPQIADGTFQSIRYTDDVGRTLSVFHDTTNAGLIHLDISYYQQGSFNEYHDPMMSVKADFAGLMLTVENYANTRTGEDIGLLTLSTGSEEEKNLLSVKLAEFISELRSRGRWSPEQEEVFLDADGRPLPAEAKPNLDEFLKERANREADAWGRVQRSMFAPIDEPEQTPEPKPPRFEMRHVVIVESITSNPRQVSLLPKGDNGVRYGVWDTQKMNPSGSIGGYLKHEDDTTVMFNTEAEALVYIDKLNANLLDLVPTSQQTPEAQETPVVPKPRGNNFRITDDHLGEGGAKTKFRNNIAAIQVIKDLEFENRNATPEEQETLSRYVGWGGLPQAFDPDNKDWENEYLELNALLTPEEFESARASTLNAHYTSPTVIKAMWETIERLGFTSGNVLEPSVGVGNFFGLVPENLRNSKLYGVELDRMTAAIAKQLYPNANIQQKGFEETDFSDSFFDVAVGNVPFGQYGVLDKRYDKHDFSIHNYFFAKSLDKVRPDGVVAFVTSKFTMDERNPKVRKYLAERAELLGAVRLPNTAFLKNAGTETTMDILFLQKRDRPLDIEPDWVHLGVTEDGIPCNRYFLDNPEMVCGTMALDEKMNNKFGRNDYTCCLPTEGADLSEQLRTALSLVEGEIKLEELEDLEGIDNHAIPADSNVKNFSYALVTLTDEPDSANGQYHAAKLGEGQVYFRENSLMYPVDLPAATLDRVKGMIQLRDCVHRLMELQLDDYPDYAITSQQMKLNMLYDKFTAEFGLINTTANSRAFNADSSYYLLSSLEILDEDGNLERKADMFTKRTIKQNTVATHVDTASEALAVSLGEKARVDLDYMSELTGKDEATLFAELQGVIFADFDMDVYSDNIKHCEIRGYTYKTADEFLSGNVREKLAKYNAALEALSADSPNYQAIFDNAEALKAVQPKDLEAGEIAVRLGSTWIEPKYVEQFMYELLNTAYYNKSIYQVKYHELTGEWQVTGKGKAQYSDIAATVTYGTSRMNAYQIIDDTLNLRDVRVYDYKENADGKTVRILNKKETMLAQQRQELIKQAFKDWIWKEPERRQSLTKLYNERFNSIRTREYDGSHLVLAGMNPEIEMRPHQLNATARGIYGGNELLAHEVGAGKTFTMTAIAMESKRLGLCQKSLFTVPNHLTEQWAGEILRLYPSANILVATKKDFEMRNRKKFCAKIATGDYDAVIIGHSQLEKIPLSKERQTRLLREQLDEIEDGIRDLKDNKGERFSIKQMEKTKKSLEVRLRKLLDAKKRDDVVTFEQLGCDRLFVDEAHFFKNLMLYTKMRNVAGLSTSEAQKSSDLFMKCRYLDELTGNKGIIFATGTPVSNSITELYTMQRYLQYDTLIAKGLTHFDSWASTFGETQTSIELAPEGTGYRARTRFSRFHNLPELLTMFRDVADIQTADMLNLPVPKAVFEVVAVEPSEIQKEMVQELSERAAAVHNREVDAHVDNMLKITTDGRKIGLDQRLFNPLLPDFEGSKVNACVDGIFKIWNDTKDDRLTQIAFCDFSTPNKDGRFNVYDDIKAKLLARGIPEHEIAFIHDAETETRKKELFAKVRQGKVRVLFGSTFKLGTGTNVQDRMIKAHDIDCPWRPSDLTQRFGRPVRQGNKNPVVTIARYVTKDTFDAYLWQTVENKQKIIGKIMSSKSPVRSCEDVDETALSYAEIKALCAGDPRIREKMNLDNDVAKLRMLKSEHNNQHYRLEDDILKRFPEQITSITARIAGIEQDSVAYTAEREKCAEVVMVNGAASASAKFPGMTINGVTHTEKEPAAKALLEACKGVKGRNVDTPIGEYMGFKLSLQYESFGQSINLLMRGVLTYKTELGTDALGNITRINNSFAELPKRLAGAKETLANVEKQIAAAKSELEKPFAQEAELSEKLKRLIELNSELNIDGDGDFDIINDTESRDETETEQSQDEQYDERDDDEFDDDYGTRQPAYAEPRTGTYGKARPSILTDLETTAKSIKPPIQGGGKSAEIDI